MVCVEIRRKISQAINLAPNGRISIVASRSLGKASTLAKANNFPPNAKIYGSYKSLLDDPNIDAVYLPFLTSLHLKRVCLAIQKKNYILPEKRMGLQVGEFDMILEGADYGWNHVDA